MTRILAIPGWLVPRAEEVKSVAGQIIDRKKEAQKNYGRRSTGELAQKARVGGAEKKLTSHLSPVSSSPIEQVLAGIELSFLQVYCNEKLQGSEVEVLLLLLRERKRTR